MIERMIPELDLDGVIEVEAASFIDPRPREMFFGEIQDPKHSYIYVLRAEGERVAAYCSCRVIFKDLHINNLAVLPKWRGQGLASALIEHVLRKGLELGAIRVTLEVRQSNRIARHLYETLGFKVIGTRRNYYSILVEDALILSRKLLSA